MYYEVLAASKSFKGKGELTYSSGQNLNIGQIVSVSIRNSQSLGVIVKKIGKPDFKAKNIDEVLDFKLNKVQLDLINWLKLYYPAPISSIVSLFLPPKFSKIELLSLKEEPVLSFKLPPLTEEQNQVISAIGATSQSVLLRGETASGKTRVYIECAQKSLKNGRSVLILTPEIGLTSPLKLQFEEVFGTNNVVVLHSAINPGDRSALWQKIYFSKRPLVVIGPRSALFAPIDKLGLVVVDEAHDNAYKQEQQPYYLASRVAAKLAKLHDCLFIMGTATPNIVDYYNFESKKLKILNMAKPAIKTKSKVEKLIVDLKDKSSFTRSKLLSNQLLEHISAAIEQGEQSLIFLNRRGSARLVVCSSCGWQALCPRCDVSLIYHEDKHRLLCHSCGYFSNVMQRCPDCGSFELLFKIGGTKAIESELVKLFPKAKVRRFDKDTASRERLHHVYKDIVSGNVDIVVGTQTIAKGFDLPKLSVIGVVQADSGLLIADYTAAERTYQLITQVSGRIGRGHLPGTLILQTYHPDSPLIKQALNKDYLQFYENELKNRLKFGFPPKFYCLKISSKKPRSDLAANELKKLAQELTLNPKLQVKGPMPRYPEKVSGSFRWQLIVFSKDRQSLSQLVSKLPINLSPDMDPSDLL